MTLLSDVPEAGVPHEVGNSPSQIVGHGFKSVQQLYGQHGCLHSQVARLAPIRHVQFAPRSEHTPDFSE